MKTFFWRIMCRLHLCGGYVEHEKDEHGVWWCGLRCATCQKFLDPIESQHQDARRNCPAMGVTELCAEHPCLAEYIKALEKRLDERTFQLGVFSDEVAKWKTQLHHYMVAVDWAMMHLETNIDADGNSMADSDAMRSLRRAVSGVPFEGDEPPSYVRRAVDCHSELVRALESLLPLADEEDFLAARAILTRATS